MLWWFYIIPQKIIESFEGTKMKKLLALVLALMLCFALVACTSAPAETAQAETTQEEPAAESADGEETAEEPAEEEATDSESDLAYIQEKGTMIVGYTLYAPMNYEDESTGELTGFDTELTKIVAEKLGVEAEFVLINWDTKEIELAGKSIDAIWNGFTLTPEREAEMACTQPYVKNAQVIVTKEGFEYSDTSSLIGATVVAEIGSAGEAQITGEGADANLAQADYIGKTAQVDCLLEIKAGTADAAVLDLTLAKAMTGEGTDYTDIVMVDSLAEEFYGVGFRQGSDVAAEVNKIFDELTADGTLAELAEKYNLELAE